VRTAYRAARLFDGTDVLRSPSGMAVVVSGGRIDAVVAGSEIVDGCLVLELGDATILPGLIDVHVHLTWDSSPDPIERVRREPYELTILRAANHAAEHLRAGVTTVRDLGSTRGLAIEVARAIDDGIVAGSHIVAAGRAIAMTGGHVHQIAREADGPDDVRRAVREELKAGARCIKIMASGGAMDGPNHELGAPQFSDPELRAAVEEARRAGRAVAAHAHSLQSINNALDAGVQSVEHGTGLDDDAARRMSREGVCLVPTLSAVDSLRGLAREGKLSPEIGHRIDALAEHNGPAFRTALRHQVPIVAGSDSGVPGQRHGSLPDELAVMVREGATPLQALRAATLDAAGLLGVSADHGSLEPGKRADLLVVGGDPVADVTALREVRMVLMDGQIVVDNDAPDAARTSTDVVPAIRRFARAYPTIVRALSSRAEHSDFSLAQQRILLEVGARAGVEIAELRSALDIDAGQLSRAVRELRANGTVEVRQCSHDRRRRTVVVTEVGRRAYERLSSAHDKTIGELLDSFSDAEQARLVSAMDTLHWFAHTAMRR
jgi:imidazolonepropionase-like amidohydrolase/DNA-binding MarR family transcriptional regulator